MVKKTPASQSAKKSTASKAMTKKAASGKKTVVSFLLDETGSMRGCLESTISGFNEYIQSLRGEKEHEDVSFTLVKFNSRKTEIVHLAVPLDQVAELDQENYRPTANTPLYDAIGQTITAMEESLKRIPAKVNVLVVIMTDGAENASRKYDRKKIFQMIEEKKKEGWLFVFLGADQDAYAAASGIGVGRGSTMSYSSRDTARMYRTLGTATNRYFKSQMASRDFFTAEDQKQAATPAPGSDKDKSR